MDIKYIFIFRRPRYRGGEGVKGGVMAIPRLLPNFWDLLYRLYIVLFLIFLILPFNQILSPYTPYLLFIGVGFSYSSNFWDLLYRLYIVHLLSPIFSSSLAYPTPLLYFLSGVFFIPYKFLGFVI